MVRQRSKLSNCYTPLPLPTPDSTSRDERQQDLTKSRPSSRLRRLVLESSVVASATGSASVDLGDTKVICQVLAPLTSTSDRLPSSVQLSMDTGTLHCQVKFAAQFGFPPTSLVASSVTALGDRQDAISAGRLNATLMRQESNLSSQVAGALAAVVPLQQYPKCAILVSITVLQNDGDVLAAAITAASLALADAGVELFDLVTAARVAVVGDTLLADPTLEEESSADALMTLAILPNWKEVTLWEQVGRMSPELANSAMELCRNGCRTMHRFMREHMIAES